MYKCGLVAIIGRANVGKSTLLNALLGQKITITSPHVQTTRFRIRGILTIPKQGQIIFIDTPGFLKPKDKLGKQLVDEVYKALEESDSILFLVDGSQLPGKSDSWLAEQLKASGKFIMLAINKIDTVKNAETRKAIRESYLELFKGYSSFDYLTLSALTGKRLKELPKMLLRHLPEAPPVYDEETLTDQRIRDIAQEIIREKLMQFTEEELPHNVTVLLEKFDESDPACTHIYATLFVNQKSQKGMVIGKGGQMIKKIGQAAREEIEYLIENPVYLDLNVKVKEN